MWKSKQRTIRYFSIGIASSLGSYLGFRYHVSKREINAEDVCNKDGNKVIGEYKYTELEQMCPKIIDIRIINLLLIQICFQNSVIIIGAGVMGLGTAFHLAQKGFDVTILEKEDSVASVSCSDLYL